MLSGLSGSRAQDVPCGMNLLDPMWGPGRRRAVTWSPTALAVPHPVAGPCPSVRGGSKSLTLSHHEGEGPGSRPSVAQCLGTAFINHVGVPIPASEGSDRLRCILMRQFLQGFVEDQGEGGGVCRAPT